MQFALDSGIDYAIFGITEPYPGTELWIDAQKYGYFDTTGRYRNNLLSEHAVYQRAVADHRLQDLQLCLRVEEPRIEARAAQQRDPGGQRIAAPVADAADDEVVAGFVGTFGPWHGVEKLAEAIKTIPASEKVRFLLVGSGS